MVQLQLSFSSITELEAFLAARRAQPVQAGPAVDIKVSELTERIGMSQPPAPAGKRGPKPKDKTPVQATVTGNGAGAATAATTAVGNNGASVQPATPPEAGATGAAAQLPLTGVEPPPAPIASTTFVHDPAVITTNTATATETEMKDAAKSVIAKLGQIEGMNKAREVLERVAGVKLIRDVPADKYGAVKAAMDGLLA